MDKERAKAFFEQKEGKTLPLFKGEHPCGGAVEEVYPEGGFDIDE